MVTQYAQMLRKLPSWLYRIAAKLYIDKEYPRHIFIETSATCNLSCVYCPREKVKADMDFHLFKDVVREASRYGRRSFSLHLFGEPLLYSKWYEAIRFIKSQNKHHTVLFTTNGTQIEKGDILDRLTHSEVDQVFWSWRPEVRFKKETKEKLKKWGKFRVRFIKELTPSEAFEEWKSWGNTEQRNIHNYGEIDISRWNAPPVTKRYPCYHLWLAPAVAWNGNILLCCADPHQKEVLGKFPKQSLSEVWTGENLKSIRDSHLRGEYTGICKECDVWKSYPNLF